MYQHVKFLFATFATLVSRSNHHRFTEVSQSCVKTWVLSVMLAYFTYYAGIMLNTLPCTYYAHKIGSSLLMMHVQILHTNYFYSFKPHMYSFVQSKISTACILAAPDCMCKGLHKSNFSNKLPYY